MGFHTNQCKTRGDNSPPSNGFFPSLFLSLSLGCHGLDPAATDNGNDLEPGGKKRPKNIGGGRGKSGEQNAVTQNEKNPTFLWTIPFLTFSLVRRWKTNRLVGNQKRPLNPVNWFQLGVTRFDWVLPSFTRFYLVLLGLPRFNWVLPIFTGFYWVPQGFTGFLLGFTGFYWVLPSFTGFYWVLLGFTGFYWVLLGFTGIYWDLLGFTERARVAPLLIVPRRRVIDS